MKILDLFKISDSYNLATYLATASLYTNPDSARCTISRQRSEPSSLGQENVCLELSGSYSMTLSGS